MTILAAYKRSNKTVFVSDFRVSFDGENQVDTMSKFLPFDNRLGFFTSGSVRLWKSVVETINTVIPQVDIQNVCDENGPLFRSLRKMTEETPFMEEDPGYFGGFGFYINSETKQHILFQIEGQAGHGIRIFKQPEGISVVGSGTCIPRIEDTLEQEMDRYVSEKGFYIKDAAEKLRSDLKGILIRCGSSSFKKLGISPIFNISGIIDSSFEMFGEEIKGGRYVDGGTSKEYHFSFERLNGKMILCDRCTNKQHPVHDITTFPYGESEEVEFDPEGLTKDFDPSCFVSGDNIYFINQWVFDKEMDRVIYKTTPFIYKQRVLADPNYIHLAKGIRTLWDSEIKIYKNIRRYGLIIPQEKQKEFEHNVQSNLFDEEWLSKNIKNMDGLLIH